MARKKKLTFEEKKLLLKPLNLTADKEREIINSVSGMAELVVGMIIEDEGIFDLTKK